MKKRYWIALGLAGALATSWWLRRKGDGRRGLWVVDAIAALYGSILQLWIGDDPGLRQRLVDWAGVKAGESVLDLSGREGRTALAAARAVGTDGEVIGIASSDHALAQARQQVASSGLPVAFRKARATDIPFTSARFSVVTATLMWHHLSFRQRDAVISEAARVLRLGGRFFVADVFPIAERPIVASRCFRVLKRDRVRRGPSMVFMLLAERISKNPPKPKNAA